jgi:hypothetical protein
LVVEFTVLEKLFKLANSLVARPFEFLKRQGGTGKGFVKLLRSCLCGPGRLKRR